MINLDDRLLSKLNPNELFLLLQIVKRMRVNKMVSWPSIERLQDECDWDERTVKKWRSSLIEKGYIQMQLRPGKPTLYWLKGTGIGVYHSADTEKGLEEGIEEGTKNEGVQNLLKKRVQKMRVKRVQKMTPELVSNELVSNEKGISDSPTLESSENLEAEKKENAFIPRGAAGTDFQVTAMASPTEIPGVTLVEAVKTRAENTLEAEQMITGWITGEGEQTVKHRYNTAKQRFDPSNAAAIAAHYCSVYTKTAANKGRLLADPITHFSDGLFSYLKNEETFGRNNQPGNQAQVRNGAQGQKANINNLGSNPERYAETPLF